MPGAETAPVRIARHVFDSLHFDLAAAKLPVQTDSVLAAWRAGSLGADQTPGLLGRVGANLAFLAGPAVVLWWLVAAIRRRKPPLHPWRRRFGMLGAGLVIWILVVGTSIWFYGRV
jgi:hypothetical protein